MSAIARSASGCGRRWPRGGRARCRCGRSTPATRTSTWWRRAGTATAAPPRRPSAPGTARSARSPTAARCSARPVPRARARPWIASLSSFLDDHPDIARLRLVQHLARDHGRDRRLPHRRQPPRPARVPAALLDPAAPGPCDPHPHHLEDIMKISVIGTGYLGATHAACMAELGFEVRRRRRRRSQGRRSCSAARCRSSSPGLEPLLRKHVETGRLRFTTSCAEAAAFGRRALRLRRHAAAARASYAADTALRRARPSTALAPHLTRPARSWSASRPCRSAPRPRLRERLGALAPPRRRRAGVEPGVPARGLRGRGHAAPRPARVRRTRRRRRARRCCARSTPRSIDDGHAVPGHRLRDRRAGQGRRPTRSWPRRSRFINAMAEVCEATGADVTRWPTRSATTSGSAAGSSTPASGSAAAACPRTSGPSWPAAASSASTRRRGVPRARSTRSTCVAGPGPSTLAHEMLGGRVADRRIAVLGAAFKPNSDDVRDSPALDVADQLHLRGGEVAVYDPQATDRRGAGRRTWCTSTPSPRRAPAPTWSCCSPSGRSSGCWTPPWSARGSASARSSTAATCCRCRSGNVPAGSCVPSAAAPEQPCRVVPRRPVADGEELTADPSQMVIGGTLSRRRWSPEERRAVADGHRTRRRHLRRVTHPDTAICDGSPTQTPPSATGHPPRHHHLRRVSVIARAGPAGAPVLRVGRR